MPNSKREKAGWSEELDIAESASQGMNFAACGALGLAIRQ